MMGHLRVDNSWTVAIHVLHRREHHGLVLLGHCKVLNFVDLLWLKLVFVRRFENFFLRRCILESELIICQRSNSIVNVSIYIIALKRALFTVEMCTSRSFLLNWLCRRREPSTELVRHLYVLILFLPRWRIIMLLFLGTLWTALWKVVCFCDLRRNWSYCVLRLSLAMQQEIKSRRVLS